MAEFMKPRGRGEGKPRKARTTAPLTLGVEPLCSRGNLRDLRGKDPVAVVVSLEERNRPARADLSDLLALTAEDMAAVNTLILSRMQSPVALIPQLAGHLIAAGGKRLRPMLTVASARLCGYQGARHHRLAAAVEFIHTATLLHDDVVDESDLRRGLATANAVWGNKPSVLVGDFLFARAFELMVADGSLRVLDILSRASAVITEGEVMQLVTANDVATSEGAYLEVIKSKTAALFAAACRIGAVIADRPRAEEEALDEYGRNLGIVYQLVDDALDYSADQAKLGKTVGDDFKEGKITLPTILAYLRGDEEERAFWRRALEELHQEPGDLERAIQLMRRHGALEDTILRARHYGAMARDALGVFAEGREKRALVDVVDFCIERGH
jgi:octaprenyl-diphosphate synthase